MKKYDLLVIGGGTAGLAALELALAQGLKKVALAEASNLGGT
jgi:pyruvate/2-oxoglutarate dehydrogenase complex dihydrolipoamide dehydrogenase (E3) component